VFNEGIGYGNVEMYSADKVKVQWDIVSWKKTFCMFFILSSSTCH